MATSHRKPSVRGCSVTGIGKDQRGSPQGWARFCKRSLLTKDGSYVRQISREQEIVNAFWARSQHEPLMIADTGVGTPQVLCKSETSSGARRKFSTSFYVRDTSKIAGASPRQTGGANAVRSTNLSQAVWTLTGVWGPMGASYERGLGQRVGGCPPRIQEGRAMSDLGALDAAK